MKYDDDDTQTVRMWPWRTEKKAGHKSIRVGPAQPHKARLQANEDDNGSDNTMRRILPQLIALSPPCRSPPISLSLSLRPSVRPHNSFSTNRVGPPQPRFVLPFLSLVISTVRTTASEPQGQQAWKSFLPSVSPLTLVTSLARSARSMACLPFPLSFSLDSGRVSGVRCSRHSNCHWWMRCLSVGGADREWHGKQRPEKDPTESRRLDGHGK